jgi:hypothetical protein
MATPKGKKQANPMLTRNGKTRLGPLNVKQLSDLLEKTQQKKNKRKIINQIARKQARLAV